jgi:hypothetical protein
MYDRSASSPRISAVAFRIAVISDTSENAITRVRATVFHKWSFVQQHGNRLWLPSPVIVREA